VRTLRRALYFTMNVLCSGLSVERSDETAVYLQDSYEQQRNDGHSVASALSSCTIQLTAAFVADWWQRVASRPLSPISSSITRHERFQIYRGQAAIGALLAVLAVKMEPILAYDPSRVLSDGERFCFNFVVPAAVAFVAVCRTAFKRGEYLPLAILYACGMGAFIGAILPLTAIIASSTIGIEPSMYVQAKLVMFSIFAGSIMNVYAKYLSPDRAIG
jgi:hypothetical protein